MRILLTRPREDAEALAATLRGRGHTVTIEPLFVVWWLRPVLRALRVGEQSAVVWKLL